MAVRERGRTTCPFYTKRCSLVAPCCGYIVCCHRCHDKEEDHKLPRHLLRLVVCNSCGNRQKMSAGDNCMCCGIRFADYFCMDCGMANSDLPSDGYFHCDACGICRVGSRQEFFHCHGCGCCLRRQYAGNHICWPDVLKAPCPICWEDPMFDSQKPAGMLTCGHMAHQDCIANTTTPLSRICRACSTDTANGRTTPRDSWLEPAGPSRAAEASASSSRQAGSLSAQFNRSSGGGGRGSSGSGYVRDLMDVLGGGVEPCELEDIISELYDQQLLPQREVKFLLEGSLREPSQDVTLQDSPRMFRRLLEASIVKSLLLSQPEIDAKGIAINTVVQLLLQGSSKGALQLQGQRVTIDRVAVAGSVGKSVCVPRQFDIDLVAFVNLPCQADISIDLYDPDKTAGSQWMRDLKQQLCSYLQKELTGRSSMLQCIKPPCIGRAAITFRLVVHTAEEVFELEVDVLLAPNMAAGAGADAAAAAAAAAAPGFPPGISSSSSSRAGAPADVQIGAVLTPVLALADSVLNGKSNSVLSRQKVQPAYTRSIWLAEAATEFVQQAGVAAATGRSGLSGRVVTSTIRLVKSWVRTGLQPSYPGFKKLRSFMIELLVLHAAERFAGKQAEGPTQHWGGRYVLDLLLEVLEVAQDWAAAAAAAAGGGSSTATSSSPILFTGLGSSKYYSRQQAEALQQLAQQGRWPDHQGLFKARPVVIHPVDPLCNVFDQQEPFRFKLWEVLGQEAEQLQLQLQCWTWSEIEQHSSLKSVLGTSC